MGYADDDSKLGRRARVAHEFPTKNQLINRIIELEDAQPEPEPTHPSYEQLYKERDEVIAAVRKDLDEFFRRNGKDQMGMVAVTSTLLNNLAHWTVASIPPGMYRVGCGPLYPEPGSAVACACTGYCQRWAKVKKEWVESD
jgi:hypothetical protein